MKHPVQRFFEHAARGRVSYRVGQYFHYPDGQNKPVRVFGVHYDEEHPEVIHRNPVAFVLAVMASWITTASADEVDAILDAMKDAKHDSFTRCVYFIEIPYVV